MTTILDTYYAFRFLYLLTKDFEDTDAFKLGIIDKDGKQLKKIRQLRTSEEKKAFTRFHKLVFRLKELLNKVPMASSTIGRYATAIMLIKEEVGESFDVEKVFRDYLEESDIILPFMVQYLNEDVDTTQYTEVFGLLFDGEELIENFTTGVDMPSFAGSRVFKCNGDVFNKCRHGKEKFKQYKTFVGEDDEIIGYARGNPKKNIILQDENTGAMLYLRRFR